MASLTDSRAPTAIDATHRITQSHEDMVWEDDSTLEWDVYLSNNDISTDGYVRKVSGGYAVGSMPQDKQLVNIQTIFDGSGGIQTIFDGLKRKKSSHN